VRDAASEPGGECVREDQVRDAVSEPGGQLWRGQLCLVTFPLGSQYPGNSRGTECAHRRTSGQMPVMSLSIFTAECIIPV